MNPFDYLVILGPTASGKTKLAVALATKLDGEIISADSRQVYNGMNIGTGKDLNEYKVDHGVVPYHLINILNAGENYSVATFQLDFELAFEDIRCRNKFAIVCGGTGMYINAILHQYEYTHVPINEELRNSLASSNLEQLRSMLLNQPSSFSNLADTSTHKRAIRAIEISNYLQNNPAPINTAVPKKAKIIGIHLDGEVRRRRISERLVKRIDEGLVQEVQDLLNCGISADKLIFYGLEYKLITQYLLGQYSFQEMMQALHTAIHQFAKRQMTYFRKMERDGHHINWLDGTLSTHELQEEAIKLVKAL